MNVSTQQPERHHTLSYHCIKYNMSDGVHRTDECIMSLSF